MRAGPLILVVLAAASCASRLSLPAEPQEAAGPEFLGDLSGFYSLSVPSGDAHGPTEIPLGSSVMLLHVENPEGGADPVFGTLSHEDEPWRSASVDAPAGCRNEASSEMSSTFVGTFDRSKTENQLEGIYEGGHFKATRPAGGGAMVFNYAACPGMEPVKVHARRDCSFDSALSGVYRPPAGQRGAPLALGVRAPLVVGMEWPSGGMAGYPATSRFLFGLIDQFDQGGRVLLVAPDGKPGCGAFDLTEASGRLSLAMDVAADSSENACFRADEAEVRAQAGERLTRVRDSGSQGGDCRRDPPGGLLLHWHVRACGLRRYLDVRVLQARTGNLVRGGVDGVTLDLQVAGAGGLLEKVTDLAGLPDKLLSARYEIGPRPREPQGYAISAWAATAAGFEAALPACVIDGI